MLSVYDLLTKSGDSVGEIMTHNPTSVLETVPIRYVRTVLIAHHMDRVPVTDVAGRLVGIITIGDLVRELAYRWSR
jgi:CBS domain-containing protein